MRAALFIVRQWQTEFNISEVRAVAARAGDGRWGRAMLIVFRLICNFELMDMLKLGADGLMGARQGGLVLTTN